MCLADSKLHNCLHGSLMVEKEPEAQRGGAVASGHTAAGPRDKDRVEIERPEGGH